MVTRSEFAMLFLLYCGNLYTPFLTIEQMLLNKTDWSVLSFPSIFIALQAEKAKAPFARAPICKPSSRSSLSYCVTYRCTAIFNYISKSVTIMLSAAAQSGQAGALCGAPARGRRCRSGRTACVTHCTKKDTDNTLMQTGARAAAAAAAAALLLVQPITI